jgi:hypothetical protein
VQFFQQCQNPAALHRQIGSNAETPHCITKGLSHMKPQRRWLKSVIATSAGPVPAMPWTRDHRRKPLAIRLAAPKAAIAAR